MTAAKGTPRPISASRLAQLADQLTPRERTLLDGLGVVRIATTEQLARVVIGEAGPGTAVRLVRRHLQRLRAAALVRRFEDRAWDRRAGAPGYVHALTAAGLRLVGSEQGIGIRQRSSWRPSYLFLAHALGISELYVRLTELERGGGPRLREFRAEGDAARFYRGPSGEQLIVRPDALVRLGVGDTEVSHFVEIDRGTETSPSTIAAKCAVYRRYELSGEEARQYGVFPGVLFIVPDAKRGRTIATVISRLDVNGRGLFAVATEDEAIQVLARVDVPTAADRPPPQLSSPVVGSATTPH
jgi:hypothetical protein